MSPSCLCEGAISKLHATVEKGVASAQGLDKTWAIYGKPGKKLGIRRSDFVPIAVFLIKILNEWIKSFNQDRVIADDRVLFI